jgi:hypothetical protein
VIRNIVLVKLKPGQDPVHNQARAGLIPLTEQIARVQFEMP